MALIGTVTSKGQTTIPKVVRDELRLKAGSRIEWQVVDGRVSIVPRNLKAVDLAGILGASLGATGSTIREMEEAMAAGLAEDDERIAREWHRDHE